MPSEPKKATEADLETDPDEAQDIVVVGTPLQRTAGSAHIVWQPQLDRFEYDDPHDALSIVPGVYTRGEDGMGLRPNIGIRGVNPDRSKKVTLMEDGVLLAPAPYSAPAAYYFPMMTRLVQLRVIKGPGAVGYGPATVGGAIDVLTRPVPSAPTVYADIGAGEHGYFKAHGYAGAGTHKMGFLLDGVHLQSSGFKHLPSSADTGFSRNEIMAKGAYHFDPIGDTAHSVEAKLTYSDELSNETYLGLTDDDFADDALQRYPASSLDRMRNHRNSLVLTHHADLGAHVHATTNVYRNAFYRVWRKVNRFRGASLYEVLRAPDTAQNQIYVSLLRGESQSSSPSETLLIGPNERDFLSQGVQTKFDARLTTGPVEHRMEYGLRVHHDRIQRRHSEDGYLVVGPELFPEGSATTVTALNEASTLATAFWAADAATWGPLTLTPGLRVELMFSDFDDRLAEERTSRAAQVFIPGVGAYWAFTPELGALAGAYRGFSPPPPGSPEDVDPESSVNYEVGARYASGSLHADAIGFYNDYVNLTDVCTFSGGCVGSDVDQQFDAGAARIFGLEASAGFTPSTGDWQWPLLASYTLSRGEFLRSFGSEDPIFGDVESGDEMPYVPTHMLTLVGGAEHARVGISAGFRYVSAMREEPGMEPLSESLVTDEQITLDVAAYIKIVDWLKLYANVDNVTDQHALIGRRPYGARPSAPRWARMGVKVEY